MMEMEMNAALDDDGSESSQSCGEGSSVSETFCVLEKDHARLLSEMKRNESLAVFEQEYTKLFESLYRAHRSEKELSEKYTRLEEEFVERKEKASALEKTVAERAEEIEKLRAEMENTRKLADAAHTREQHAQEVIENLKINVKRLNQEIEQKNKKLAAEEESVPISKQKDALLKEREKLIAELETLRQRLKNASAYTEELERKTSAVDHEMNELQQNIESQSNELSKERRIKQRAEAEVQQLQEELTTKMNELDAANETIQSVNASIQNLEMLLKDQRASNAKTQKEMNALMVKRMNLQTDLDHANSQIDTLHKDLLDKDKQLKEMKRVLNKVKEEGARHKYEKDVTEKRLQKIEGERARLDEDLRRALATVKDIELESVALGKQQFDKQQQIEALTRDKTVLERSKETSKEQSKRIALELTVSEHARKKIEHALDLAVHSNNEVKRQLEHVEKERNKYNSEAQELAQQVEDYISEVKLKQVEIFDYKKGLAEAETKYRQQQNLLEAVRAERNSCSKSLVEAQDEIQELKSKLKIVSHQVEQLKEDIATKDANLSKKDFVLSRVEKERDVLKVDLQSSRKEISDLRHEIEEKKEEEKRLRQEIHRGDMVISRQKKDIENVQNERDILGTQLVRRNDELSLQFSRIKVLDGTLQRGEAQYNQRLEDIRLLKLEVKKLRTEKSLLAKKIANISDLRQEIYHLNRDLAKERLKVVALEEEVQTPLNIHRWRKLEGTDPERYELLKKVQILQKRVITMSADMIDKEKRIKDTEKLYINLREVLSKHPGPEVAISLGQTQKALRERGKKMKCMLSELNMYEVEVTEQKVDMARMANELRDFKRKYYSEKRKLHKSRASKSRSMEGPVLPTLRIQKKFCGGGFSMDSHSAANCFSLLSTR